MTRNQIAFAEHQETVKHNRATERIEGHKAVSNRIQARASHAQAETASLSQQEQARHNREQEGLGWWQAVMSHDEQVRSNHENEAIKWYSAAQSAREAAVKEKQLGLNEREVSVKELEADTHRYQAETGRQQIGLGYSQLAESIRHNSQQEIETALHNRNVEDETKRANLATELNRFGTLANQRRETSSQIGLNAANARANTVKAGASQTTAKASMLRAQGTMLSAQAQQSQAETASKRQMWDAIYGGVDAATKIVNTGVNAWDKLT